MPSLGAWKDQIKKSYGAQKQHILLEQKLVADKIIKHAKTVKKSAADWPNILSYISNKFPNVDITNVPIYVTHPSVMSRYKIHASGCYIIDLDAILVRNKVGTGNDQAKTAFDKLVNKQIGTDSNVEDVVVHELLHAVSYRTRGIKFRNAEEEFVYTNCVPFYKSKGMTDQDIINTIIIPFCFNDVMDDSDFVHKTWNGVGVNIDEYTTKLVRVKVYNKYAEQIVPIFVKEANTRAQNMIDLYYKYGQDMAHCNVKPKDGLDTHFDTIDMDADL
jgi:hypothetical protein